MELKITVQISKRTRCILKDTVILKLIYKGRFDLQSNVISYIYIFTQVNTL